MINYSLICEKEHAFEAWFASGDEFDAQKKRGLVTCPICDSQQVEKSLMAPSLTTREKKSTDNTSPHTDKTLATNANVPAKYTEMMNQIRDLRDHVQANAEDVGSKFPEEARKIHYGEAQKRGIYGQASVKDVKDLVEEGVEVMPLPDLPEDKN